MDSWTSSVVELAEAHDFAAYGLYYNNLRKMLLILGQRRLVDLGIWPVLEQGY